MPSARRGIGGAGVMVLIGLLLLVGGAVYYILNIASPAQTQASPPKPIPTAAFDDILNSAQSYINKGENEKAEAILKQVTASHPEAQAVHILYAQFLAGQKRPAEAYKQYQAAKSQGPLEPQVELEAGTAANMSGQFELALEHYSAAQAADPTDYRAAMFLAQVQLKLKRTAEAKVNLLHVTKLNPAGAAPAWATLAQIYLDENSPDIALNFITHARDLAPKDTVYRVIQARAFKRKGDAASALDLLIGLDEAQKREPGVMQVMSECFGMLSRPADAAKMYTDASDSDPTQGDWAFQAAVWLEKAGDPKRGAEYAKRAATLNVEGAAALAERLSK